MVVFLFGIGQRAFDAHKLEWIVLPGWQVYIQIWSEVGICLHPEIALPYFVVSVAINPQPSPSLYKTAIVSKIIF